MLVFYNFRGPFFLEAKLSVIFKSNKKNSINAEYDIITFIIFAMLKLTRDPKPSEV